MRARRHPIATLLIALALLGAQGSGFLHLVLVEHERCGEHGEIVEAHHQPRRAQLVPLSNGQGPAASGSPGATHGHDHCLVMIERRAPAAPATLSPDFATLDGSPVALLSAAHPAPPGPPLYRLAPKNSPPA